MFSSTQPVPPRRLPPHQPAFQQFSQASQVIKGWPGWGSTFASPAAPAPMRSATACAPGTRWPCGPAGPGQRLIPLKVARHLLKARAVRPKRLHLLLRNFVRRPFHVSALGAQLGYLAVHGLRQPAHVVQVPLPLLRLPALPKPGVEGPRLLQFSVALQQQRLQVVTGVRLAEPPEHPRLVAGLNGHHAFTLVRLRLLPLQHAQRALLLSCELRRLRCLRCLNRCLRRCLSRCLRRRLKWRRLWLALWGSWLSRHVLLRFVLAQGLPRRFGSAGAASCAASAQRPAQRVAPLAPPLAPLVRSAPFNYTWSRYNTNNKDDPRSRTTLCAIMRTNSKTCCPPETKLGPR